MTEQARLAPSAELTAVRSGRTLCLDQLGRPAAVLCFGQSTAGAVDAVVEAIRGTYPEEQVLIVSLVNLQSIPKMLRTVAEMTMNGRYDSEAKKLREGLDPTEHIVILPDWDGSVTASLDLPNVDKQLAVVVLAADGTVAAVHQEAGPEAAVVGMLEPVISS